MLIYQRFSVENEFFKRSRLKLKKDLENYKECNSIK